MNQQQIALKSKVLSGLANEVLVEIGNREVHKNHNVEKYLLGVLERTYVFTNDISNILSTQPERYTLSAFVISRVLLDDFLHCYYLFSRGFEEQDVNKFDAEALKHFFAMGKESLEFNNKYFDGKKEGLINEEIYISYSNDFIANPDNQKYLENVDIAGKLPRMKFQPGITTSAIFHEIHNADRGGQNSNAYIMWRQYSRYIHHSTQTLFAGHNILIRTADVEGIRLVLFYACKTVILSRAYFYPDCPEDDPIFVRTENLTKELGSK